MAGWLHDDAALLEKLLELAPKLGAIVDLAPGMVGKDDELADAIGRTLDNSLPRETLLRRAEFFSVDRAIEQYEQLIAEVVAEARYQN